MVLEALKAGRALRWIALDERAREHEKLERLLALARAAGVVVRRVPRLELDRMSVTGGHNGVIAEALAGPAIGLEAILEAPEGESACVVALGHHHGAEDVGAVIRTALAAGATGIVVPPGAGPVLDPVARRVSMGAAEHVRVARVAHRELAREARAKGLRVFALGRGVESVPWHEADLRGDVVLLLDSPPSGQEVDAVLALPEGLPPTSIAAVILYERERQGR